MADTDETSSVADVTCETAKLFTPEGRRALNDSSPVATLLLSEARKAFLDSQAIRHGDNRAEEDVGPVINFLIDFAGDVRLSSLNRDMFTALEKALTKIPARSGVPRREAASLMTRYQHSEQNGWGGLEPSSEKRLAIWSYQLNRFFSWLTETGLYCGPQYKFKLVSDKLAESKEPDAWTDEELKRLFSLPLFTGAESAEHLWAPGNKYVQNELYWAYLLIFFTGMRASEISTLRVTDIVKGEGDLDYFDLHGGAKRRAQMKSSSRRLIPIPRLLLELGLLDRKADLEAAGTGELFPEWIHYAYPKSNRTMSGHHLSKSWQYVKQKFGFDRPELTIHIGRQTKATWLDAAGIPDRIRERLMSHGPATRAETYGAGQLTLEEAKLALKKRPLIEEQIGEILMTAKLRAQSGTLEVVKTWVGADISRVA